jgi:hypothetical protein
MPVEPNPILDLAPGIGQVKSMVKYMVLDIDLTMTGEEVHPLGRPSLSASTSGAVKRQLSNFVLEEREARDLDMFRSRIMPVMILEDGTAWSMGVYLFTDSATRVGTYASTFETILMDQDYILSKGIRRPYGVNPGGSIPDAINEILDTAHIYSRSVPVDTSIRVADPTVWPIGTSRMDMLKILCTLAGWLPPYFDNNGVCVIRPPRDPVIDDPDHSYTTRRMKRGSLVMNDNLLDAPNIYTVISTGPTKGEITADAEVDPSLPYSAMNRGFENPTEHRTQGLVSTQQAQDMANALALGVTSGFKSASFIGPPDPRHDLFDTIEFNAEVYTETEWSLVLGGSEHSHNMTIGGFKIDDFK